MVLIECRQIVWTQHGGELKEIRRALESAVDAGRDEDAVGGLEVLIIEIIDIVDTSTKGRLESSNIGVL